MGLGEDFELPVVFAPGYLTGDTGDRVGEGRPLKEKKLLEVVAIVKRPLQEVVNCAVVTGMKSLFGRKTSKSRAWNQKTRIPVLILFVRP